MSINGEVKKTFPRVYGFTFSPDGKRYAYFAARPETQKSHLVVDGKEAKEWAAVGTDLFWSADNRTVGYVATPKGKTAAVVVVGDKEWPAFDETTPLGFSPDGIRFAARVRHTEQQSVVLDGRRRGPYEEVDLGGTRVGFTPDGKVTYVARKDGNAVVWVEELCADLPDGGPLLAATPKGGDPAGGGWVPLFNGRDLANRKVPERSEDPTPAPPPPNKVKWAVVNGAITFTGRDTSHRETVGQDFRRFHLRAEIQTRPGTRASFAVVVIDNGSAKSRTGSMVGGIENRGDGVTEKAAADARGASPTG